MAAVVVTTLALPAGAWGVRGYVRSSLPAFGGPCTGAGASCEPGQVKEPDGMAVNEATGEVYVVDKASNTVDVFNSKGSFESELTGPHATGTGTLTEGSTTVEVSPAAGFTVGEEISGEGIPPGATITGVEPFGVLAISQPVEAGKSGLTALTAQQRLKAPEGVAVDNSCTQRKQAEPKLTQESCEAEDPSNGDVYVQDGFGRQAIDKFTAAGEYIGQITGSTIENPKMEAFGHFSGVSVDPRGKLWVAESHLEEGVLGPVEGIDDFSNAAVNVWEAFRLSPLQGVQIEHGLAVDGADDSYVRTSEGHFNGGVGEVGSKGDLIHNAVGAEVASGVAFTGLAVEPATGDVYIDNVASVGRFGASSTGQAPELERFGAGALPAGACDAEGAEASCAGGIAVDAAMARVYVADSAGEVLQFVLEEPSVPRVQSVSVVDVTDDSARLGAEINPRTLPGESATSYRFEYGACSSPSACSASGYEHSAPVPDGLLPAGFEMEGVSAPVQGLRAGTTYHFRVLAENGRGPAVDSGERTFTTRGTGEFTLADSRQWQLVSPPDKHGGLILPIGRAWAIQAAASGTAMSYAAAAPTEAEPAGFDNRQQVLSTRNSSSWSSQDLAIPHVSVTTVSTTGQEYQFFSEDLSQAALQPFGSFVACHSADGVKQPCLSPAASEQTAFVRSDFTASGGLCTGSCYTPLVSGCPPPGGECRPAVQEHANVPPGTIFGQVSDSGQPCPPITACGPQFRDATLDLSHVLLTSRVPLTSDPVQGGLYEWSPGRPAAEQLRLVSVAAGSEAGVSGELGPSEERVRHAISPDGSRVVWDNGTNLYLRLNATAPQSPISEGKCTVPADACTVQLDVGLPSSPVFQMASADLSRVIFIDAGDLYEYDVSHSALQRVTEGADVQGLLAGASDDASWVYFVANGVLGDGAEHGAVTGNCKASQELATHACNLYVRHAGKTELVAVLSAQDAPDWGGAGVSSLRELTTRVAPGGEWLAFMSLRSLTGYDNRDAVSGRPDEEVFLYHASTGKLVCASCDPSGARPHGLEYGVNENGAIPNLPLVGGDKVWPGLRWLAGNVPAWTPATGVVAFHQSRYLSDSGRLFFNAASGLVPKDVNGGEDVYEFEPAGFGGCSPGVSSGAFVYVPGDEGCVGLMSSGSSAQESAFLDASESGGDVFFLTTARLSALDSDTAPDVYDAHICTSTVPCLPAPTVSAPACDTEASCKDAPSLQPQIFGLSGSATFSGAGNLTPAPAVAGSSAAQVRARALKKALRSCRKLRSKKRRAACSRRARKRYGPMSAHGAAGRRRAGR